MRAFLLSTLLLSSAIAGYIPFGKGNNCYQDSFASPVLGFWFFSLPSPQVNLDACRGGCATTAGNYTLFGVESSGSGFECWCGTGIGNGAPTVDAKQCNLACPANSKQICGGPNMLMSVYYIYGTTSSGMGASDIFGWVLIGVFFGGLLLYFVIGILVMTFVLKKTGPERIPQGNFWVSVPGLMKDGVMFVAHGFKPRAAGYESK